MKKTLLSIVILIGFSTAYSQTAKGTLLIGGNASFDGESQVFSARAQIGSFISKNFAVGGEVEFQSEQFGLNGFVRKYFGDSEKGKFFAQAKAGLKASEFNFGVGAGYAMFIRPTIAFELAAYYNRMGGSGYFQPLAGFQIHLPKKK